VGEFQKNLAGSKIDGAHGCGFFDAEDAEGAENYTALLVVLCVLCVLCVKKHALEQSK